VYKYTVHGCLLSEASLSLSLSVYTHMHVIHDCLGVVFQFAVCMGLTW